MNVNIYSKIYNGKTEFTYVAGYEYSIILRAIKGTVYIGFMIHVGLVPGDTYTIIAAGLPVFA